MELQWVQNSHRLVHMESQNNMRSHLPHQVQEAYTLGTRQWSTHYQSK